MKSNEIGKENKPLDETKSKETTAQFSGDPPEEEFDGGWY